MAYVCDGVYSPNPSVQGGCYIMSIFKPSLTAQTALIFTHSRSQLDAHLSQRY